MVVTVEKVNSTRKACFYEELTAEKQKGPKSFLERPFETPPFYEDKKQMRVSPAPGEAEPETVILVNPHKGFIEGERLR